MLQHSDYEIQDQLYDSASSMVFRASRKSDRLPVILKVLKEAGLNNERLERYQREFDLLSRLSLASVVRVYDFARHQNGYCLALEDFGGESLKARLSRRRFTLSEFLDLAIKCCSALAEIHLADIIHKDINPANLLCNPVTGELKIIDFGISSLLPRLSPALQNPAFLEGTLPYIAPEQTGRMNRSLDYRADFYSLGATFFEMLSGQTPFSAEDPTELVYCHIARRPPLLTDIDPSISPIVAEIVDKLLEKNAEDRYQSAWGIEADLRECRRQLETRGHIEAFHLARQDTPHRFQIAQQLYGRQGMVERLMQVFAAAQQGPRQMVLIGGNEGVGKTSLVRELYKPMTQVGGSFIRGKFDQFQKNSPYSALLSAFHDLVQQTLAASEQVLADCRQRILAGVGANAQVLIQMMPELELIIGAQPPVAELPAAEAQHRFNLVFQQFIQAFCLPGRPLIIFIDDLQWADLATLKLLEKIMGSEEMRHLILICAYRDQEVSATHPLMISLSHLSDSGLRLERFTLSPLVLDDLVALLADTLKRDAAQVMPLAELVLRKTLGNPFFVTQFLKLLYAEHLIEFHINQDGAGRSGWRWDLEKIIAVGITDNVIDLMVGRLRELPEATRDALKLAACIGNFFSLDSLAMIQNQDHQSALALLMPALQAELLEEIPDGKQRGHFHFLHDRIQQAAYSLLDEEQRRKTHVDIGRRLLAHLTEHDQQVRLFEIVDHLNIGCEHIVDRTEKLQLARLNLAAGQRAMLANAFQSAGEYLALAAACLPARAWNTQYALTLEVYQNRAQARYLNADYAESMADIAAIRQHARSALEKASICALLITELTMLGRNREAVAAAGEALALLDIEVPFDDPRPAVEREIAPIKAILRDRSIASLEDLPPMCDPVSQVAMKILMPVHSAAYFGGMRDLHAWFLAKMTNLSLNFGHTPESLMGYASFGGVLCSDYGEFQNGYDFARLALKLTERYPDLGLKCRISLIMVALVNHWHKHVRESELYEDSGIQAGTEASELQFVSYLLMWGKVINRFHRGANLLQQLDVANESLLFTRKVQSHLTTDSILGARAVIGNLAGLSASFDVFDMEDGAEADYIECCKQHSSYSSLGFFYTIKAQALYLHGLFEEAHLAIEKAASLSNYIKSYFTEADLSYYHSLILLALDDRIPRPTINEVVGRNQALLQRWATACPENFQHKFDLVEAERARLENRIGEAISSYDQAIQGAAQGDFIQDEALANELACRFWIGRDKTEFALIHLRRAYQCFQLWGARRKLEQLNLRHGALLARAQSAGVAQATVTTIFTEVGVPSATHSAESLDINALIDAAHVFADEIQLKALKHKMMRIAMANAGADSGFLMLYEQGALMVEARASVDQDEVNDLPSLPLEHQDAALLPIARSIVNYVLRSSSTVVLADACRDERFALDPYILAQQPKSIFCLPLIHQGKLSGVLYLENNLACGAFSSRCHVLELLSSHMAIAIENARIHSNLDQLVQTRTAQWQSANQRLKTEIEERITMSEALREAQEKAEAATRAKSDFLARMSHEIRTPMNAVIGLSQLLLRTDMTPKQRDYLQKLGGSAQTLLAIINDILDFSKIEAGRMTVETIPFRLQDVLDHLTNVTVGRAEEQGLEILFALHEGVPEHLEGDPLRLGQVLINLVGNAIKFTPAGDVLLEIRALRALDRSICLHFSVRDTGIGMTPEQVANLFQSFHQADGSITRRFGGTGLGLAIARQLIELMQGKLTVDSVLNQGTTFSFDLPFGRVIEETETPLVIPSKLVGARVLVVDDNGTSREILSHMLLRKAFKVDVAASGEAALQMLEIQRITQSEPYALVLMDWKMPGLDGIETTRRIKHDQRLEAMPAILMVTAFGREEVMREAEEAGLDGFLVKPVGESLLYDTILDTFGYQVIKGAEDGVSRSERVLTSLADIRGARILLVEDNLINQQIATEYLRQIGMVVDVAIHGRAGVEMAASGDYDLVLMDIQMPEMDGFEATRLIRAQPHGAQLPIVAMTAHAMAGDREKSLEAGMFDHLTKPIDFNQLGELLVRWIKPGVRSTIATRPPIEAPNALDSALPRIEGLDTTLGTQRVGGSVCLYLKLLRQFSAEHVDEVASIRQALAEGRAKDGERMAHSVKGAAASLGALTLADAAAVLERALRENSQEVAGLLVLFAEALDTLIAPLNRYFAVHEPVAAPKSSALEQPSVQQRLRLLLPLLLAGDSLAEEWVDALCADAQGAEWLPQIEQIAALIEDVEFELAYAKVEQLLGNLDQKVTA